MALVPDFQSDLTNHFFKGFKISSHFIDDKAKEIGSSENLWIALMKLRLYSLGLYVKHKHYL